MAKIAKISLPIEQVIKEYDSIREQEKIHKERKAYLATLIKEYAQENGVKNDKGSFYVERDDYMLGKQCKKTIKLDEEKAVKFLKENPLTSHCVVSKEVVDEEALSICVEEGVITQTELEDIVNCKVDYSVSLKPLADMTEVEIKEIHLLSAQVKKRR